MNRRSFAVSATTALSATLLGDVARGYPTNERINVGVIGSGGRARHVMNVLKKIDHTAIIHVCDVWDVSLNEGVKIAGETAKRTKAAKELLANNDVHAVLIGTPDHWHVPMTILACEAGKDVYVEKPLTHSPEEGKAIITAVEKTKRIVQVGTQQRSMPHVVQAKERIDAGKIGQVVKVRMSWNRNSDRVRKNPLGVKANEVAWNDFLGNAPKQPFEEYRFRNWRWFWDFGGGIFTDLMVHWIDVAHYVLGVDAPTKAVSLGEFVTAKGVWETPDTVQTILSYPNGLQMHFEGTFSNANKGSHIEFLGKKANLYIDRGRFELTSERNKNTPEESVVLGTGVKGLDFYDKPDGEKLHLENWLNAIRTKTQPSAPVKAGVAAAQAAHLANDALRKTMGI